MRHEAPRAGRDAARHWHAAREGRLEISYCPVCATFVWPARIACRRCETALVWRPCSGAGKIVTYSIVRRAVDPALKEAVPYVVAIVELDEGVRIFTNIVDADPGTVSCGQRVSCQFEPTADPQLWVPVFKPS